MPGEGDEDGAYEYLGQLPNGGGYIYRDPETNTYYIAYTVTKAGSTGEEGNPIIESTTTFNQITAEEVQALFSKLEELYEPDQPRDTSSEKIFDTGQGQTPDQSSDVESEGKRAGEEANDSPKGNKVKGDPIVAYSGQFIHQVVDIEVNGRNLYFSFRRSYLNQTMYKGPLGYNWDHNYNLWLRECQKIMPDGTIQNIIYRSTGELREDPYVQILESAVDAVPPLDEVPDAIFHSPRGFFNQLIKSGGKYSLEDATGTRFEYNDDLRIARIVDPNENEMIFEYTDELLTKIRDPVGKEFIFQYDEMNRIHTLYDTVGDRKLQYYYGSNGDLEEVDLLLEADYVTGTDYRYLGPNHIFELQHNLVEIIRFTGGSLLENEYGMQTGTLEFNKVTRQRSVEGEYHYEYGFVYDSSTDPSIDPINVPSSYTRIFYPNEHPVEFWFNTQGNALRKSETIIGKFGNPIVLNSLYRYNEDSRLIEESLPSGASMKYYYQRDVYADIHGGDISGATPKEIMSFGNLIKTVEHPRSAAEEENVIVTEYSYYDAYNRIKSVKGPYYADPLSLFPFSNNVNEITYEYDTRGNLVKINYPDVQRPDGTVQSLEPTLMLYDAYGMLTDITNGPIHTKMTYFPDTLRSGFVQGIIEDANNSKIKTDYEVDKLGRVKQLQNHFGATYKFEWTGFDTVKKVEFPASSDHSFPTNIVYEYNKNRELVLVKEEIRQHDGTAHPDGLRIDQFIRDTYGRIIERISGSSKNPKERISKITYTPFNLPEREINSSGSNTYSTYNERMALSKLVKGWSTKDEATRKILYNEWGAAIKLIDGRGFEVKIDHDGYGRPNVMEDSDGNKLVMKYDASDRVIHSSVTGTHPETMLKDVRWSQVEYRYDKVGRLNSVIEHLFIPGTQVKDKLFQINYFYDAISRIEAIENSDGSITNYNYDAFGRLMAFKDMGNNELKWIYDDDPATHSLTMIKKDEGLDESDSLVTQYFMRKIRYNKLGLPVEEIDGLGNSTTIYYNSQGMSTYKKLDNYELLTRYNVFGQPVLYEATDSGNSVLTTLEYDNNGRLEKLISPTKAIIRWTYDNLGRVLYVKRGNSLKTYTYDKESNITSYRDENSVVILYHYTPGGYIEKQEANLNAFSAPVEMPSYIPSVTSPIELSYTPLGSIAQVKTGLSTLKLAYDSLERIIEELQNENPVKFKYDSEGRITELLYPSGRNILYKYSQSGDLTSIKQLTLGQDYPGDPSKLAERVLTSIFRVGSRINLIKFEGCSCKLLYDHGMKVLECNWTRGLDDSQLLLDRSLYGSSSSLSIHQLNDTFRINKHDNLNRLIKSVEHTSELQIDLTSLLCANSESDLLWSDSGQITMNGVISSVESQLSMTTPTRSFSYLLDDSSNRLKTDIQEMPIVTNVETKYNPDAYDRYLSVGGVKFIYDLNGNILYDGVRHYRYDAYNRVTEMSGPFGHIDLEYDGLDRNSSIKYSSGDIIKRIYAGSRTIGWSINNNLAGEVVPLEVPNQYAHVATEGVDISPLFDLTGSILGWVDSSGNQLNSSSYDPFGQPLEASGETLTPFGFAGYWYEKSSEMYLPLMRTYHPGLGRFLQRDPLGLIDGTNQYLYVHHSPGSLVDYWGFDSSNRNSWGNAIWEGAKTFGSGLLETAAVNGSAYVGFVVGGPITAIGIPGYLLYKSLREGYEERAVEGIRHGKSDYKWRAAIAVGNDIIFPTTTLGEVISGRDYISGRELSRVEIGQKTGSLLTTFLIMAIAAKLGTRGNRARATVAETRRAGAPSGPTRLPPPQAEEVITQVRPGMVRRELQPGTAVNPYRYDLNCVRCVWAYHQAMEGFPVKAGYIHGMTNAEIEAFIRTRGTLTNVHELTTAMIDRPNSAGIVIIEAPAGEAYNHAVYVRNEGGIVAFHEAQAQGGVGYTIPPPRRWFVKGKIWFFPLNW